MEKTFTINENRCSIICKLWCRDPDTVQRVVLCCHGFAGSMESSSTKKLAERIVSSFRDAAVLSFHWPCHGTDCSPKLTLPLCNLYLMTVISHIRETFPNAEIFASGISFGGYLLLKYLHENENPFQAVALRSAAISIYQSMTERIMTTEDLAILKKKKTVSVGFAAKVKITADFLEELRNADPMLWDFRPFSEMLLLIHGTNDEIIPVETVRQFAEKNNLLLLLTDGADHRFSNPSQLSGAMDSMIDFLF